MAFIQCGVVLLATSLVSSHPDASAPRRVVSGKTVVTYSAQQMESYMTQAQIGYIRPGFKVKLLNLTDVAPGKKPVVEISYTDDMDQPLDYAGKVTPGALSISFILAWYDAQGRQYTALTTRTRNNVTNPSADQNGTWDHVELGHSKYTFGTTLPSNLDVTKTHTLAIYGRRSLSTLIGKDYYPNNINYDFRPDGNTVTETWAAMDEAKTCNNCHDPLAFHGGQRRTVKGCVLCHTPQIAKDATTGNTFDFKVMIHKIHAGAQLPSVIAGGKYGFGTSTDFSTVMYPQDLRNCESCHHPTGPESHIWYSRPTRNACGSCHDGINWTTGAGHVAGPFADDKTCASCHIPDGADFDVSIKGAHLIPTKSTQLKGLKIEITKVDKTAPGEKPIVSYKLTDGKGAFIDPKTLNRLRFLMAGPNQEIVESIREDANTTSLCEVSGICTYTFAAAIPATATGSWTMSADVYRTLTLDPSPGATVREAAINPVYSFAVTDATAKARRTVVDVARCNKCHGTVAFHGGQRFKIEECVICHHPNATDDQTPPESIHLKYMVHRIHTGEELERDYTIGDANYNEVLYPGDRRNCEACHTTGTFNLPLPDGVLPTKTARDWYTPMQPVAASCLSCHSSKEAAAHAYMATAPFAEACESCHGPNAEFSVAKVHAR